LYADVHSRAHSTSIFRYKIDHNFSTSNLTVGNCLGHQVPPPEVIDERAEEQVLDSCVEFPWTPQLL